MGKYNRLSFNGHETFYCKFFWLKKGYDYLQEHGKFNTEDAIMKLGVGKNMITSIRYWMRAFGLIVQDAEGVITTKIANELFSETGWDSYLENIASTWLLHYYLITTQHASIYSLVFNKFKKERVEFSKSQLSLFLKRICEENQIDFNVKTVNKDIQVFINNYTFKKNSTSIEDDYSSFLPELNIVEPISQNDHYRVLSKEQESLPAEIVLFAILDVYENQSSISFRNLMSDFNSPGAIFSLNEAGLLSKIKDITEKYETITYSDYAGVRELQIKGNVDKWKILEEFYAK